MVVKPKKAAKLFKNEATMQGSMKMPMTQKKDYGTGLPAKSAKSKKK